MADSNDQKFEITEMDRLVAQVFREKGFEYTARYVETFGMKLWNPAFHMGTNQQTEQFYKKCVDEGHPYDWYFEFPDDAIF